MQSAYLDLIALVERLHRQFLEVVKLELDTNAVHDINNVQAMILYNIGDLEMTVGELTLRGCYLGSNVSYNVKKMLENGYIVHERHMASLAQGVVQGEDMVSAHRTLRRLERFWTHAVELGSRAAAFPPAA